MPAAGRWQPAIATACSKEGDAEEGVDEFRVAFVRDTCGGVLRAVDHLQDACRQGGHGLCGRGAESTLSL
ncbi:hypothetical protein E2C01_098907 [Portunus trituberculatus]|uniref:Uncharacterized protein n=1 Tax=Portunus trituberculatus TaxID=210409 RepID=A0A5B7KDB4_PORTR|nr:hypothetical protein [Portunus trituberculatus]